MNNLPGNAEKSPTSTSTTTHTQGRPSLQNDSINTFLAKYIQQSHFSRIKYFDLPNSVSCPVNRNAIDEECLPLASVSKGCASLL